MVLARFMSGVLVGVVAIGVGAQEAPERQAALQAFEQGQWAQAIDAYRVLLDSNPDDGLALLRIAQAERKLSRHAKALETLEQARAAEAPEAMVDLERALDLAALGQADNALRALSAADHDGLRALTLLEDADELDGLRDEARYQEVYRSVRHRVFPCEALAASRQFDFWVGRWEVRSPDGTPVGHSRVTKEDGGCAVAESWQGAGGSSGRSLSYFLPSKGEWRQVWVGSGGTLIDISGGPVDGGMHLEGTIEYVAREEVVAFRGTWTPTGDGRVRQLLEEFDLASQSWRTWFEGVYSPETQP
jgi:hypothetical protein